MRLKKVVPLFALVLMVFAVLTRYFHTSGVSTDGAVYLQIARNILLGKGLGWQALWFPPLHSILIALVSSVAGIKSLIAAASVVSAVSGVSLAFAVYFLGKRLFDQRTALCAAMLSACFPHLVSISFSAEAEITYTLFLVLSLGLLTLCIEKHSFTLAALTGLSFSLTYLARSEGFLIMLFVCLALAVFGGKSVARNVIFKLCATVILVFFVVSIPYLLFLHKHYGAWVISPKTSYVMIWMKSRIYHDNNKGEVFNDELWGLTPGGKLRWQEPKGARDLVDYLMSHPGKSLSVYWRNLKAEIPGRIPNGSGMEHFPQVFPVYFALPALLTIFFPWGRLSREKKAIAFAPVLIFLVLPIFTEGWWKYLVPYAPLLIILAVRGYIFLVDGLCRLCGGERHGLIIITLVTGLVCARFLFVQEVTKVPPTSQYNQIRTDYAGEVVGAGKWAVAKFGPGKNYMVAWSKLIYHLDGLWTPEPVAELAQVLQFGRAQGVDYVVKEMLGERHSLEEIKLAPPGLEFAGLYRSETRNYQVAFYRFL